MPACMGGGASLHGGKGRRVPGRRGGLKTWMVCHLFSKNVMMFLLDSKKNLFARYSLFLDYFCLTYWNKQRYFFGWHRGESKSGLLFCNWLRGSTEECRKWLEFID